MAGRSCSRRGGRAERGTLTADWIPPLRESLTSPLQSSATPSPDSELSLLSLKRVQRYRMREKAEGCSGTQKQGRSSHCRKVGSAALGRRIHGMLFGENTRCLFSPVV